MEITLEQVLEAIGKNPSLIDGLIKPVFESEKGKTAVGALVQTEVSAKIAEEIGKTHTGYDNDMFEILGEKPTQKGDGTKQKTYEKNKELLKELADLRKMKDGLTKDAEVMRLTAEIEAIKKTGGGEFIKEQFEAAKADWLKEKETLTQQIEAANKTNTEGLIGNEVQLAVAKLKFNDAIPEGLRKLAIDQATKDLTASAKIENGKVVFYSAEGKPVLNSDDNYSPADAGFMLSTLDSIKEITLKTENTGHKGAAGDTFKGAIKTATVEGKETKSLSLEAGSFKTKTQFQTVAEKAMLDAGISRRDPNWNKLKDDAYKAYEVNKLPIE